MIHVFYIEPIHLDNNITFQYTEEELMVQYKFIPWFRRFLEGLSKFATLVLE